MEDQILSLDIISTLPDDIIGKILCCVSIKDAVRTSVLSSKWKYQWMSIRVLRFDEMLFLGSLYNVKEDWESKFFNAIYHVLLFHRGSILQFSLYVSNLTTTSELDKLINYLSTNNTLKSFFIEGEWDDQYKLPSSLFSFQGLEDLSLEACELDLPSTFNGLSKLRRLSLHNVLITAKMLQRLLISCPQLEKLELKGCPSNFKEETEFTYAKLSECLPSVVHLEFHNLHEEYLAAGGMPSKPLTTLVHLEIINVVVILGSKKEIVFPLCLIKSSPNLKKITMQMLHIHSNEVQIASMNFPDHQDYSGYNLNHLKELEIEGFHNVPFELGFVKLILAKSPVLEKVKLKLSHIVSVDEVLEKLRDLLQHRASPTAKFIIERSFFDEKSISYLG